MKKTFVYLAITVLFALTAKAQTALYPRHFALDEVTLLDGPLKEAQDLNFKVLTEYDVDRLLTPYVRQSGLAATTDVTSPYYQWTTRHPNFTNWGEASFDLSGHVGGHYLTALALATAACHDEAMRSQLKERMDYMVNVMKDCQDQYDNNEDGLRGFIGGQPMNNAWKRLAAGTLDLTGTGNCAVPWYCQHKIMAGLRDAYVYGGNDTAREVFLKLCDWTVNVTSKLTDAQMQQMLDTEHGGVNEVLLDAYSLTGEEKYLSAAKRFSHRTMLDGMQSLSTTFLDGRHANTQVPKYIGFERIGEQDATATNYLRAAENFWQDVAGNRTVCIGGNSVSEHFLSAAQGNRYIDVLDGPESCNSNNMLKLTEMMSDRTIASAPQTAARYADFYEQTMWNHILSTQDPETGGYVYFTTLRPQGYRIYSQVNQAMWCCVGTGMENHSKYGHFIYTHDGTRTLYVNLFTPSVLQNETFGIRQETLFPFIDATESSEQPAATSTLTVTRGGTYQIALRHPAWAGERYSISVNGVAVNAEVEKGTASYVTIDRTWSEGDRIEVRLPMTLTYEACPNYTDYIAFCFGPILLAANVSPEGEQLQNEYAGEGRMDHAPGSVASPKSLLSAPLLIGERADVLRRIAPDDLSRLRFTIDASREGVDTYKWGMLQLQPFYQIHHARYQCYWYQQTAENFASSSMARDEAAAEALQARTLDFVAPGEQQSEAGHECQYSSESTTGTYNGEHYRDARANGYIQYTLYNPTGVEDSLSIMLRFTTADRGRKGTLTVDGQQLADITIPATAKGADQNGFFNMEIPIPASLAKGKTQFVVRLTASASTLCPGLYYVRLMRGYDANNTYRFVCTDWTTGDVNRVAASNITYDTGQNLIHVRASGNNNVCLSLRYADTDYTIASDQTYLVVRGTNLSTASSASYLWWLNGTNHGTQVSPQTVRRVSVDGEQQTVVAWNLKTSGLYENFSGDRPNVCQGQTIFGLTSTTGQSDIRDICFVSSVSDYLTDLTTAVPAVHDTGEIQNSKFKIQNGAVYDLGGRRVSVPSVGGDLQSPTSATSVLPKGAYIGNGRKFVVK